jgi:arylsulfatase A-like enzyme
MNGGQIAGDAPRCHGGRSSRSAGRWTGTAALVALLAALMGAVLPTAALGSHEPGRPNILLILTDDQRAPGTMEVMPQTRAWFETGGTKFPNAFVTTPGCCPSRASIFSGKYVHNHNVKSNEESQSIDQRFTIQEYLKQSGYRTGFFGKYFNAWNLFRNPTAYDDWSVTVAGYSPIRVNENGVVKNITQYSTSYFRDNALRFIQEAEAQDSTPWFLEVATTAPHSPFTPESQYANASVPPFNQPPSYFESDKRDKPPAVENENDDPVSIESTRVAQLRTLKSVDDLVGSVFNTLELAGEESNTLAIFMSDNGYMWGEHGLDFKGFAYDESIRVPMYVRFPGHVPAGGTDSRIVANIDVAPTLAEAAGGLAIGQPMDGRSILSFSTRSRLLAEWFPNSGGLGWASLRTATSHYIEYYDRLDNQSIKFREYYDLTADPYEMENLLGDGNAANDPNVAALSAQLSSDRACSGANCP